MHRQKLRLYFGKQVLHRGSVHVGGEYIRIYLVRALAFVPDNNGHSSVAADEQAEASAANAAPDPSRRANTWLAASNPPGLHLAFT